MRIGPLPALLLLALPALAAPAKTDESLLGGAREAAEKCHANLERGLELERELQAFMDDAAPILAELEDPARDYSTAPDVPTLRNRRWKIDDAWGRTRPRYEARISEFSLLIHRATQCEAIGVVGGPITKAVDPASVHLSSVVLELERFNSRQQSFLQRLAQALVEDNRRFEAELERRESARLLRRVGWALAVMAAMGLAVSAWRLRASRKARPASPAPGAVLGGAYRVERELGRGSMGTVYEAVDLGLGRKVALKRVSDELARDPAGLEELLKEARSAAALQHPNILSIYSVLQEGGMVCLVLELATGTTLDRRLAVGRRLPLPQAKSVVRQVCAALEHAHERRVIHRDLKPSNIMVAPDGSVKVMDFGIAKHGTPLYMAPEQELGTVSKASDLFAAGACAYELLTGARPFPGPDFLGQKRRMEFTPPSQAAPDLPKAADGFMRRALAPDPASRFASAAELAAAFQAL